MPNHYNILSKRFPQAVAGSTPLTLSDLSGFPILTTEVGYAQSPMPTSTALAPPVPGSAPLGQIAFKAVADVLGWKPKPGDVKGFLGSLNASFTCTEVEGHTECTWTPRTYAVATDLSGGITGAQASIYSRAQDASDESLPLLEGLYSLDAEADAEDITALKAIVKSQITELVRELGLLGGPRIQRVNQYFSLILGGGSFWSFPTAHTALPTTDPDQIGGTLGNLRNELGLTFTGPGQQDFVNSVEDEQNLTNFRILADYMTSLAQSWLNNLDFFGLSTNTPFFGTQLVLLSRQLSVVSESVDELRFNLDSVFLGPAERQTLKIVFTTADPPMFLEDLLAWIQNFATEEGPRIIQDGGKFGVGNTFLPITTKLAQLAGSIDLNATPAPGLVTVRVQRALQELVNELNQLASLASKVQHTIQPEH